MTALGVTVGGADHTAKISGATATVTLPDGTDIPDSVTVKSVSLSSKATGLASGDEITLTNGQGTITITAEDGAKAAYTITAQALTVTATEVTKKAATDVRDSYGLFEISADNDVANYYLAVKETGEAAPTATEMTAHGLKRTLSSTPINVLIAQRIDAPMISKNTEVVARPEDDRRQRRRWSAEEKKRIAEEAEACTERGALAALLRRGGLYSQQLQKWREQLKAHGTEGLKTLRPGPKPSMDEKDREIEKLKTRGVYRKLLQIGCKGFSHRDLYLRSEVGRRKSIRGNWIVSVLQQASVYTSRVSNDNPFSESCFKTIKQQPDYPGRFEGLAHARKWCNDCFDWYANQHRHSGISFFTPADVFRHRMRLGIPSPPSCAPSPGAGLAIPAPHNP